MFMNVTLISRCDSSGLLIRLVRMSLLEWQIFYIVFDAANTALWDNRITQHIASWDYEGTEARHGTRVTSLAEKPYFDSNAPSRREALGLDRSDDKEER